MALKKLGVICSLALVAFAPTQLSAHPHAWISMKTTLKFNQKGKISAVFLEWTFDRNYTALATEGLDGNKDGKLDRKELAVLSHENIKALEEYNYFSYLKKNGKLVGYQPVSVYSQYIANEQLTMAFKISLKKPIDPKKAKVELKVFDPSFYIAMDYQKTDPIRHTGAKPAGCKIKLMPILADEEIDKKRQMLSTKDKDWTASPAQEFGSLFAQPLVVDCSQGQSS